MSNLIRKKRMLSVLLIAVLAAAIWFVCAESVHAAATKTFYKPTRIKTTHTESGYKYTSTQKLTYYDTGLLKKEVYEDGYSAEYTYNENGLIQEVKSISEGKVTGLYTVEFKDDGTATGTMYGSNEDDEMVLESTSQLTYKDGLLAKEVVNYVEDGIKETTTYYPNGQRKKIKSDTTTIKFNKKGDMTNYTYTSKDGKQKEVTTYKYTYKKGHPTKLIETQKNTVKGKTSTVKRTYTYTNKYDKKGNLTKCTVKVKTKIGKKTYTSSTTTTYKYKKFKVEKKYWKLINLNQG